MDRVTALIGEPKFGWESKSRPVPVMYLWPDGRMVVGTGGGLTLAEQDRLRDNVAHAADCWRAGQPVIFDGIVELVDPDADVSAPSSDA